jgi:SAM-dependent methyltransferase
MNKKVKLLQIAKTYFKINKFILRVNQILRRLLSFTHYIQYRVEWTTDHPTYFDHSINLYYSWYRNQDSSFLNRGFFARNAISRNNDFRGFTLDLCCGDGFFSHYFYSSVSTKLVAVDRDSLAITNARLNYGKNNITFKRLDILRDFPRDDYDSIIWDASIHYFDLDEIDYLLTLISNSLVVREGLLAGSTVTSQNNDTTKHHKTSILSSAFLRDILEIHFKWVAILEREEEDRTSLYFLCSDFRRVTFSEQTFNSENSKMI